MELYDDGMILLHYSTFNNIFVVTFNNDSELKVTTNKVSSLSFCLTEGFCHVCIKKKKEANYKTSFWALRTCDGQFYLMDNC